MHPSPFKGSSFVCFFFLKKKASVRKRINIIVKTVTFQSFPLDLMWESCTCVSSSLVFSVRSTAGQTAGFKYGSSERRGKPLTQLLASQPVWLHAETSLLSQMMMSTDAPLNSPPISSCLQPSCFTSSKPGLLDQTFLLAWLSPLQKCVKSNYITTAVKGCK